MQISTMNNSHTFPSRLYYGKGFVTCQINGDLQAVLPFRSKRIFLFSVHRLNHPNQVSHRFPTYVLHVHYVHIQNRRFETYTGCVLSSAEKSWYHHLPAETP